MSARDRLTGPSNTGVWYFTDAMSAGQAAETAGRIESLGYSTLWVPETLGRDPFAHLAWLGSQTTTLQLATGIAGIFNRQPGSMVQAANTVNEQTGGRLVLGLGVSHSPMVEGVRGLDYSKPLTKMREYLAAMDAAAGMYMSFPPAEPTPRLLAALGPKMLELSAAAADGAHPYFTTPEHTAEARAALGPDKLLCVEQKVVLSTDPEAARSAAIAQIGIYANLPNYRNNWKRLGFTEDEIEHRANRFVDHVIVWGDEDRIRAGIQAHFDAGADHVCIQPVSTEGMRTLDWNVLEALAPAA
ncbi:MAG TPA: TIGR03620 family F420-dependent LLM class oxidoreductase [Ilumatobacteraceae bacterium]|nr:TIGR03620 family F420-dependent LLM class oxidoreductase [Ilumatobacteraceae bacterium]